MEPMRNKGDRYASSVHGVGSVSLVHPTLLLNPMDSCLAGVLTPFSVTHSLGCSEEPSWRTWYRLGLHVYSFTAPLSPRNHMLALRAQHHLVEWDVRKVRSLVAPSFGVRVGVLADHHHAQRALRLSVVHDVEVAHGAPRRLGRLRERRATVSLSKAAG
jgi:hypothetical protein